MNKNLPNSRAGVLQERMGMTFLYFFPQQELGSYYQASCRTWRKETGREGEQRTVTAVTCTLCGTQHFLSPPAFPASPWHSAASLSSGLVNKWAGMMMTSLTIYGPFMTLWGCSRDREAADHHANSRKARG